ncbi:recombinase family protein [Streptacidiphilus anmyonensis]|uniref:recombinase family protein n=1 Tax=Streptacidiphilus anmyonensis TaxID=405782 RepID=UPI0007C6ED90|nr:recombinase family protein [Streptacidiphilus anmyonensis]
MAFVTSTNDAPVTPYDGCGRCLLGVRRLSRVLGATSSPARQRDLILEVTAREGGHVVAWADDWEVSGATDPFTRPKLGPWLRLEQGPFDGLAASAVDRLGRDVYEGLRLARENAAAGRRLLTADHLGWWDLSDPGQEMEFTMKLFGAQIEHRSIRTRIRQEAARARKAGQVSHRPSYGYVHVRLRAGTKIDRTELEPDSSTVIREVARRILADEANGTTVYSEAARLNRACVPSPADWSRTMYGQESQGTPWTGQGIRLILLSDAALGYLVHKRKPVLGNDGRPVRVAPPLWDRPTQAALREKVERRPITDKRGPRGMMLLSGLAWCGVCAERLYRSGCSYADLQRVPALGCKGRSFGLPQSQDCKPSPTIAMPVMDTYVTNWFLATFGPASESRKVYEPGNGMAQRIADLKADRERLRDDRATGLYDLPDDAEWFRREYARLGEELQEAQATPEKPAGWYTVPTGRTVADWWRGAADNAERREILRSFGVKVALFPARGPKKRAGRIVITSEAQAEGFDPGAELGLSFRDLM